MSTCHNAPLDAAWSPPDPCLLLDAVEPAEPWRLRPFALFVLTTADGPPGPPPVLDVERFPRFTRPPSFEGKSYDVGLAGALVVEDAALPAK